MNNKWRHKRIGDLGRIVTGKTPSSSRPECFGDEYPFVTPTDMHDQRYASVTDRFLSQKGADSQKTLLIPSGAVCVSCIGWQMGKAIVTSRPSFTNQQLHSIIPASDVNPLFLYYSLSTRREELLSLGSAGGVRTPIINKSVFSDLKVLLPDLSLQRRIAGVLSAYDDLIENNTRRIAILEEMAQATYRNWFVNFRFSGHEKVKFVNSPLGKIPEEWRVDRLDTICERITSGGTPRTSTAEYWGGGIPWLSSGETGNSFIIETDKTITEEGVSNSSTRFARSGCTVIASAGQGKTRGQTSMLRLDCYINQSTIALTADRMHATDNFVFFDLLRRYNQFRQISDGSSRGSLTTKLLADLEVIVPPTELVHEFDYHVDPAVNEIEILLRKNKNLRNTRDLLLPKLISGRLDVEELDFESGEPLVEADA